MNESKSGATLTAQDIRIGPAGNSESFYAAGLKRSAQAPAWLAGLGLNAYEYQFGRGVTIGEATAHEIAAAAQANDVEMSVHAPYFINLAVPEDDERAEKNVGYFIETVTAAQWLGAKRAVFHPGSASKMPREQALHYAVDFLRRIRDRLDALGLGDVVLCPETMGKQNQLGDLNEVIALCQVDERFVPTIDFGHLNARGQGSLREKTDFAAVLDALEAGIGLERARRMHVHFSRIEYTKGGEKRHWTFADTQFGPDFPPLAELLIERGYAPHIICESAGTQAEDAVTMRRALLGE